MQSYTEQKLTLIAENIASLPKIALEILAFAGDTRFFAFEGEMGAGKTTLIQYLAQALKVQDTVQSPTFALVNQYLTASQETIYHIDFYRIQEEQEALALGYEEYFYDEDAFCWVEWASKVRNLLPKKYIAINITLNESNQRFITLQKYE